MQSHVNSFILVCLVSLASVCFAQERVTVHGKTLSADDARSVPVPSFPYVAEIISDNVNIRSGPGTNYYSCGKLSKAYRVKIVGSKFSWSRIVPPVGSFSWISKQYVKVDPANPAVGIVTGDAVRVYAGADDIKPMHSTTMQGKLDTTDKVKLMGQERGDYYKIAPPSFAYLWVSTEYTRPLGPAGQVPLTVKRAPEADTPAVVPTNISVEAGKLNEYYALEKQIDAERAKPMGRQNYANIKKKLLAISDNKEAGKAARYCRFALGQVKRFELALAVAGEVQLQDRQLRRIQNRIDNARAKRLAEIPDLGGFAAVGRFQLSNIYRPEAQLKRYRITDDTGKTVCYALPTGSASGIDLSRFINRNVGLVGTIEPDRQTAGALVRFTELIELQ